MALIYKFKIPIDFTCREQGGLDVHMVEIEFPEGVKVTALPPLVLNCWPLLNAYQTVRVLTRAVHKAETHTDGFTTPADAPEGTFLGFVEADEGDTLLRAVWGPYTETVENPDGDQALATTNLEQLTCSDGAPPITWVNEDGSISYRCRDGSTPTLTTKTILDTQDPRNIPHYNVSDNPGTIDVQKDVVVVSTDEYWVDVFLPAVGCCDSPSGSTTTTTTTATTGTGTGTSSTSDP